MRLKYSWPAVDAMGDGDGTLSPILITGGSGAIGSATAAVLCHEHRPVVLWVHDRSRGETTRDGLERRFPGSRIELIEGDLGSLSSVRKNAAHLAARYPTLGGVVHTAAVLTRRREETSEGLERMFATNHLGPFVLNRELLDRLDPTRPFRVLSVAAPSTTPLDFDDLLARRSFRALRAYASSKTAHLLAAYGLARRFGRGPRTSNTFFPGVVRSTLLREAPALVRMFARVVGSGPDRAAESLAWLASGPPLATANGAFFEGTRVTTTSEYTLDPVVQDRLWQASEQIISAALSLAPSDRREPVLVE